MRAVLRLLAPCWRTLCLSLLATLALAPLAALAEPMVRISMVDARETVTFQADGMRVRPLTADGHYALHQGGPLTIRSTPAGAVVDGDPNPAPAFKLRADGPISMGSLVVRGAVEVVAGPSGLLVINEIPMERYLAAVLGSEMPPSFPAEALKAQAVASRTYAIGKKIDAEGQPFHLGATVLSQVYGGVNREDPRTHAAVKATAGEVLVFEHAPIEAYFFSSCGGTTEAGQDALSRALPYLTSHSCPEKADTPGARWTLRINGAELGKRLGLPAIRSVTVASRTDSGRVRSVDLGTKGGSRRLDAVTLRRRIGYSELKSLAFDVSASGGNLVFQGKGSGHGAGMCQWGASAAAAEGMDYGRILELYYPGTELRRMY